MFEVTVLLNMFSFVGDKIEHVLHQQLLLQLQQLQYSTAMARISDIERRSIATSGMFSAGYTALRPLITRHNIVFDVRSRQSVVYSALVSKANLQREQNHRRTKCVLQTRLDCRRLMNMVFQLSF